MKFGYSAYEQLDTFKASINGMVVGRKLQPLADHKPRKVRFEVLARYLLD